MDLFNVFIDFVTILLLLFMFWIFFGHEACEILVPQPEIESTPPALEGKILTTGQPGKSFPALLYVTFLHNSYFHLLIISLHYINISSMKARAFMVPNRLLGTMSLQLEQNLSYYK